MVRTRRKKPMSEAEKKRKHKITNKMSMRRARQKLTEEQLDERRKKDRERYQRKKEEGLIKGIAEESPRVQRKIRQKWKVCTKRYRNKKKQQQQIEKQTEEIIDNDTPPLTPVSHMSCSSRSRTQSGKFIAQKNRRLLKVENTLLKARLQATEWKLSKYRMRLSRTLKKLNQKPKVKPKSNKRELAKRKTVRDFLECDESSRMTSGKKETITKKKLKKQIRLLNDSMINLYAKFKSTGNMNISYSLFCKYRPFWIISPTARKRDTCLCIQHANMENIVVSLSSSRMINEKTPIALVKSLCCEGKLKEACLERQCKKCKDKEIIFNSYEKEDIISYEKWVTKITTVVIKGKEKSCQKTVKEKVIVKKITIADLLVQKISGFMSHLNNIFHQFQALNSVKNNISKETALLHMDFSENFNCKYSSEVQAAHFGASKSQVSLHTSVLYHSEEPDENFSISPYCTISENLNHGPVLICAHLLPILNILKESHPYLKTVHFASDGPCSQYRNKSMFFLLANYIAKKLDVENIVWHFSETGHGKGAPDGIGATIKRTADRVVAQGRDVSNFDELANCLMENCKGVSILAIDDSANDDIQKILDKSMTRPFKGTMIIHQITWSKLQPGILHARRLSCVKCRPDNICPHYEIGVILVEPREDEDQMTASCNNSDVMARQIPDIDNQDRLVSLQATGTGENSIGHGTPFNNSSSTHCSSDVPAERLSPENCKPTNSPGQRRTSQDLDTTMLDLTNKIVPHNYFYKNIYGSSSSDDETKQISPLLSSANIIKKRRLNKDLDSSDESKTGSRLNSISKRPILDSSDDENIFK